MALALDWWACPDCGTRYVQRIFTCPRCHNTNLERVPMPKITKHMGASVADPETGFDPHPNRPTRGAPSTDLPTAVSPTPHEALPGAEGSQAVSRAPLDAATVAAHLDAITEAQGAAAEATSEPVTYERPSVAAPKSDWLAYAQQETPEVEGLELLTKAQLIGHVDSIAREG